MTRVARADLEHSGAGAAPERKPPLLQRAARVTSFRVEVTPAGHSSPRNHVRCVRAKQQPRGEQAVADDHTAQEDLGHPRLAPATHRGHPRVGQRQQADPEARRTGKGCPGQARLPGPRPVPPARPTAAQPSSTAIDHANAAIPKLP